MSARGMFLMVVIGCIVFTACSLQSSIGGERALILFSPSYLLLHPGDSVPVDVSAYSLCAEPFAGSLRFATGSRGGFDSSVGMYTAQAMGDCFVDVSAGQSQRRLPVSIVPEEYARPAEFIVGFTQAMEENDLAAVSSYITPDTTVYNAIANVDWTEDGVFFALAMSVHRWEMASVHIAETDNGFEVSAAGSLYFTEEGNSISTRSSMLLSFVLGMDNGALVLEHFVLAPSPSEPDNPPNVKAIVTVPDTDPLIAGDRFAYSVQVVNEGGPGYFKVLRTLTKRGNSSVSRQFPAWVGAYSNPGGKSTSRFPLHFGDVEHGITLEVQVFSGPSPDDMVETDYQSYTFSVARATVPSGVN